MTCVCRMGNDVYQVSYVCSRGWVGGGLYACRVSGPLGFLCMQSEWIDYTLPLKWSNVLPNRRIQSP